MSEEDLRPNLNGSEMNASLRKGTAPGIRMKVSEKSAVSIYGMGRFPVTLYRKEHIVKVIRYIIPKNEASLQRTTRV